MRTHMQAGRDREREEERESEADSMPSVSLTTVRSLPESKSRVGSLTEPRRCYNIALFLCSYLRFLQNCYVGKKFDHNTW